MLVELMRLFYITVIYDGAQAIAVLSVLVLGAVW